MRFLVYGAGAIGGLLGARLSQAGEDVVLIARGAHAEAMEREGLVIESPAGREVFHLPVAREPSAEVVGSSDAVLLCMKSQDTLEALLALRAVTRSSVPIVCLQNGVDNEHSALRMFGDVYGVCVVCPAGHLEPGVVVQRSAPVPGILDIGRFPAGVDGASSAIAAAFRAGGFESVERPDVMRWKYAKLLTNLGNAVQALIGPGAPEILRMVGEEATECLRAAGIDVASPAEEAARRGDKLQVRTLATGSSIGGSSWQSLQRGTGRIESDYLNGEIVLLGRLHGVPTPVNELLQALAYEAAGNRSAPGSVTVEEFTRMLAKG
jgi:2-dehydropantoate 2-reductase